MSKEKINTVRLGLFVTTAVTLFVTAIYFIGNDQNLFQPTFKLNAVFQNAEGLKSGNNVRYAGIEAGTVQKIVITSDSTIRVEMILHQEMQSYIKKDAIASIGTDGLVGNKIVNISPGMGNGTALPVEDQDHIQSYSRLATEDMLEVLGKTNENIALFSFQVLKITEKINKGSGTLNLLLQDQVLARDLQQSIANLKYTTQALRSIGGSMQQTLTGWNDGGGLLHDLLYDTTIMADIRSITGNLNDLMVLRADSILLELQMAAETIHGSGTTLNAMLQDINEGQGTLGSLLRDTTMEKDLKMTLNNISESSRKLNENMDAMRHNFLFKGYFKKLEKQERKSLRK